MYLEIVFKNGLGFLQGYVGILGDFFGIYSGIFRRIGPMGFDLMFFYYREFFQLRFVSFYNGWKSIFYDKMIFSA